MDKSEGVFRVALLQKNSVNKRCDINTDLIVTAMEEASNNAADIILLPECFITGYDLTIDNNCALDESSEYIKRICRTASKLHIGIVATALTKGNEKPQNSAFVIDKNGNIIMKYSKVHTCDFADERVLQSGSEFRVCDFDGVKIGIMICYDREYPESARVLMLKGAEIILVPNDCASMMQRLKALETRSYENMTGIAMANPPGDNRGMSCAYSPICWDRNGICVDNEVVLGDSYSEKIYYADFDMIKIREYRSREMLGNTFRKVKAYGKLLSESIEYPFIR